jgi:hypothetical protein
MEIIAWGPVFVTLKTSAEPDLRDEGPSDLGIGVVAASGEFFR